MGNKMFDQFTYLHFATGIITYFWGISIYVWILIHSVFEFLENTTWGMYAINHFVKMWPGGKPIKDSNINIFGDTIGAIIGWLSAYYVDKMGNYYNLYDLHIK